MDEDEFVAFQKELAEKRVQEQFQRDVVAIDSYLAEKNIVAEKTESGMRYVVTEAGLGELAQTGQTVKVNYTGYLLDGQYFDTTIKLLAEEKGLYNPRREPYGPYEVIIDQTPVIKGWHEALKLMRKGTKATFYIPSSLAYGQQRRSEVIKPNSILVFEMELVDLK